MNSVRAYLLGTLPDEQAAAVELKYFTDKSFFAYVRQAEQKLIEDCLMGRLTPAEQELFDSRYLQVPELQQSVEEVRRRLDRSKDSAHVWAPWRLVVSGAVVGGLALGLWSYLQRQESSSTPPSVAQLPSTTMAMVSLRLSPGLTKDSGDKTAEFALRATPFSVRMEAELPGRKSPDEYSAMISLVGADGRWSKVWTSDRLLRTTPITGGSQVTITLDSGVLQPGNYVLQVARNGQVAESYVFRVNPAQ